MVRLFLIWVHRAGFTIPPHFLAPSKIIFNFGMADAVTSGQRDAHAPNAPVFMWKITSETL